MFTLTGLFIGLAMVAAGFGMVKYTFWLLGVTGPQQWLERFTGGGSTNGIYKIFGVVLILAGILTATGFGNNIMNFLLAPLYHVFAPVSGVN